MFKKFLFYLLVILSISIADTQAQPITLKIKQNKVYEIKIPSNPTTGFSWSINNQYDFTIIQVLGNYYFSKARPKMVGQGGEQVWKIKGLKHGCTRLVFVYKRPWEKQIAKTAEYLIYVK